MELEDKYLNKFYDEKRADTFDYNKPFVYKFKYIYKNGTEYEWDTVFSCFDALYESIMEPEDDVISIQCAKMQIDRLNSRQIAYLTPSFNFLRIDPGYIDSDKERDLFWGVFDGLWFDFPTPFKKGDIVWDPNKPDGICAGPFVTTGICLDGIQNDKVKDNLRKDGDSTDMLSLIHISAQLVKELSKREAVQKLNVEPYQSYKIKIGRRRISGTGPVVILRIRD